ncbi:hypothetical protein [Tellurirhabdus rosea]|uniref:hypothetical protein n=1 Tax=Tellurirhabdus rosea TaxID=2674997 RepID=UPI00224DD016|nr:hypothetical protein [Tellurirhabdus rosea]
MKKQISLLAAGIGGFLLYQKQKKKKMAAAQQTFIQTAQQVVQQGNQTGSYNYPWLNLTTVKPDWLKRVGLTFTRSSKEAFILLYSNVPVMVYMVALVPEGDERRNGLPLAVWVNASNAYFDLYNYSVFFRRSELNGGGIYPDTEYELHIQQAGQSTDNAFKMTCRTPSESVNQQQIL